MARANISAIEAGRRGASEAMVRRILDATGRPSAVLREHRDQVLALVAERGASNPRVFGSVARGEDLPGSDIDLLVAVEPERVWDVVTLPDALEELLGVKVDLVSEGGLRGRVGQAILAEAVPL